MFSACDSSFNLIYINTEGEYAISSPDSLLVSMISLVQLVVPVFPARSWTLACLYLKYKLFIRDTLSTTSAVNLDHEHSFLLSTCVDLVLYLSLYSKSHKYLSNSLFVLSVVSIRSDIITLRAFGVYNTKSVRRFSTQL